SMGLIQPVSSSVAGVMCHSPREGVVRHPARVLGAVVATPGCPLSVMIFVSLRASSRVQTHF
ncbi:MAG: hypothetical protein ACXV0U_10815, partial [Kineosporiaceae bacterium]